MATIYLLGKAEKKKEKQETRKSLKYVHAEVLLREKEKKVPEISFGASYPKFPN